jgi:hypothetical protein
MADNRRTRVTIPDLPKAIARVRQSDPVGSGVYRVPRDSNRCPACCVVLPTDMPEGDVMMCACGLWVQRSA